MTSAFINPLPRTKSTDGCFAAISVKFDLKRNPISKDYLSRIYILAQVFILDNGKRFFSQRTSQGISSVGRSVLSWLDAVHDFSGRQNSANWVHSATQGLAKYQQIWLDVFIITSQQLPGPPQSALNFISDEQNIEFPAQSEALLKVSVVGYHDP
jgi:hypothetical protein